MMVPEGAALAETQTRPVSAPKEPDGSGKVALAHLLTAHIERAVRREALLTESLSQRSPTRTAGPSPQSLYALEGAQSEAAPARQDPAPTWMPSWLSPTPDGPPGAVSIPPLTLGLPSAAARDQSARRPPPPALTVTGPPEGSPVSAVTLDQLREQFAQILRDDALRHGLNLKEG